MSRFQRRKFLIGASALLVAPFALGQPAGRLVRIGILDEGHERSLEDYDLAFQDEMQKLGYVEGKNLVIEVRFAQGVPARLHVLAAELVALKSDLIVTTALPSTQAAMKATSSIPIVMFIGGDPVKLGLVASLSRPGGNVTGLSVMSLPLHVKGLEMLVEISPPPRRKLVISFNRAIRRTGKYINRCRKRGARAA